MSEILYRSGTFNTEDINFKDRTIEVVAAPWNEEAEIVWRGQVWREMFLPGAFDEAIAASVRIPVNREHKYGDTVGRIVHMRSDPKGLLASVKVAKTPRGDDTLQLASEGILGPSLGYFLQKMSDVVLNQRSLTRQIRKARIEHLAMTETPAFPSSRIVAVHDQFSQHPEAGKRPLVTPALDEWVADDVLSWASTRLAK